MERILQYQILRGIWVAFIIVISLAALYYAIPLIYPFIIGWLIAYILNPVVHLLQHRLKAPRWLAVTSALLIFIGVIAGLITLVITRIANEIDRLSQFINHNYENWLDGINDFMQSEMLQRWVDQFNQLYQGSDYQDTMDSGINSAGQKVAEGVSEILQGLATTIITVVTALPNLALGIIVALLAAFFISKDWDRIRRWVGSLWPERMSESTEAIWKDLQKALFGFLKAQFILISITAIFVIIGLLLLRVPYAVTIGLLIGLVDLMPYLGTGAVFIPWILYVLIEGNYSFAFGLTVLYGLILVARQLAEPKVYSSSLGLNPLVTLIGIFVGLRLFGFIGLIIGPVILVLVYSFHRADVFRDIRRYIVHGRYFD
jgi:sporulation integral membrane protein YtvI